MVIGYSPTTFENGVFIGGVINLKGFSFLVIHPKTIGKYHSAFSDPINWDFYQDREIPDLPRDPYRDLSYYHMGKYTITSTDEDYQKEVLKLKSTFKIFDESLEFKAYKIRFAIYGHNELGFNSWKTYVRFVFDFDEIFTSYESYSFGGRIGSRYTHYYDVALQDIYKYDLHVKDMKRLFNSYSIAFYKDQFGTNWHFYTYNQLYFKDNKYYFFRNVALPTVREDFTVVVPYQLYIIDVTPLCCLMECFGITE